jgi:hypothetical protein
LGKKPNFGEKKEFVENFTMKISTKLSFFQRSDVGVGREHPEVGLTFIDDIS